MNGKLRIGWLMVFLVFLSIFAAVFVTIPAPKAHAANRRWPLPYREGDRGDEYVWTIQLMLRQRGYTLAADGIFGS